MPEQRAGGNVSRVEVSADGWTVRVRALRRVRARANVTRHVVCWPGTWPVIRFLRGDAWSPVA